MEKFTYNREMYQWERIDRVQEYKGIEIKTVTYYMDGRPKRRHREYQYNINGNDRYLGIDKRGGNIKTVKELIDRELAKAE